MGNKQMEHSAFEKNVLKPICRKTEVSEGDLTVIQNYLKKNPSYTPYYECVYTTPVLSLHRLLVELRPDILGSMALPSITDEVTNFYLEKGVKVDSIGRYNEDCGSTVFYNRSYGSITERVERLKKHGFEPSKSNGLVGGIVILSLEELREALNCGFNPSVTQKVRNSEHRWSVYHNIAPYENWREKCEILLEHKANPNEIFSGYKPFEILVKESRVIYPFTPYPSDFFETFDVFVKYGYDPTNPEKPGRNLRSMALSNASVLHYCMDRYLATRK